MIFQDVGGGGVDVTGSSGNGVDRRDHDRPGLHRDVQLWSRAMSGHACEQNQDNLRWVGCIGSSVQRQPPVVVEHDLPRASLSPLGQGIMRLAFSSRQLDLQKDQASVSNAALAVFAGQTSMVNDSFLLGPWRNRRLYRGHRIRLGQPSSSCATRTTTITLHNLGSGFVCGGLDMNSQGQSNGTVAYTDIVDSRLPKHFGGKRLRVIVVSPVVYPKHTEELRMLNVANKDVFGPNGAQLRAAIEQARLRELIKCIDDAINGKCLVLAYVEDGVDVQADVRDVRMLSEMQWGGYRVYSSPALTCSTKQVVLCRDGGWFVDLHQESLRNAAGVCCTIRTFPRAYGYGAPTNNTGAHNAPVALHTNLRDPVHYMEGLRCNDGEAEYDPLVLPADADLCVPESCDEVDEFIGVIAGSRGFWGFDIEYGPKTKRLGTLAFARRFDEGRLQVIVFRKQVMEDNGISFDAVREFLRTLLLEANSERVIGMFDWRNDREVLKNENVIPNKDAQLSDSVIDLRLIMHEAFPLLFGPVGGDDNATGLGLRHFVQMAQRRRLVKGEQVSLWDTLPIQTSTSHVRYAQLDAYAILLVHEYYLSLIQKEE